MAAWAANNSQSKVSLWEKKPSGRQWSPHFCCMTPLIWVSEASVAKESSAFGAGCWRGTAVARRRFAFWNASCAETVHSNVPLPPLQEISQRFQNLCTLGQKTAVKVYHAKKMLQLLDILRRWAIFYLVNVIGRMGCSCRRDHVAKDLKRRCCKHTFFQIYCETIGG
jgi:hypothetical protein